MRKLIFILAILISSCSGDNMEIADKTFIAKKTEVRVETKTDTGRVIFNSSKTITIKTYHNQTYDEIAYLRKIHPEKIVKTVTVYDGNLTISIENKYFNLIE